MKMSLLVIEGPEKGRRFDFDHADSFLVGRSPRAHFVLDPRADRKISRTHCLLDFRPPRCLLQDLESRNGTFVNGVPVRRHELKDGDEIRVGRTVLKFHLEAGRESKIAHPTSQGDGPAVTQAAIPKTIRIKAEDSENGDQKFLCGRCSKDIGARANRDGLASRLPESLYLCLNCARQEFVGAASGKKIGDYRILRELGRGGMGVVFKTVHEPTCRLAAVKTILPDAARDDKALKMFDREMAVQSMLVHPNLVRIIERGRHEDSYFFASEYLAGGDAHHLVSQAFRGPLPAHIALRIILDILDGLEELHAHGFIHRDLKPANFLLSRPLTNENWRAKITDYGLAKSYEDAGNSIFDFTRMGEIAGSMMFMPPEQILNYRFVKPSADVYAVGASLYYMLTGTYTVDFSPGATPKGQRVRNPVEIILDDPPIPILEKRPDLDPAMARIIDRSVVKDVKLRFGSAREFRKELGAFR